MVAQYNPDREFVTGVNYNPEDEAIEGKGWRIHSSSLSYDRSKASSKASSPHSAIQSFLLQMRE